MTVAHELTSLPTGHCESQTIDHVIKPTLKQRKQVFTGYAFLASSFFKVVAELRFKQIVDALYALLFT